MRNTNKKGFTIVELVIVVAVIAILAAVLIPTFSGIIRKANVSKDNQLIAHLNTALAADVDGDKTMAGALAAAAEFGYDISKINAKANGNEILWDSVANVFCYLNDGVVEYVSEVDNKGTGAQLWVIKSTIDTVYSTYLINNTDATVNAVHSLDVSACGAMSVVYNGSAEVSIFTNGGNLTVNKGVVNHYGIGNLLVVADGAKCNQFGTFAADQDDFTNAGAENDVYQYADSATKLAELLEAKAPKIALSKDIAIETVLAPNATSNYDFYVDYSVEINLNGYKITSVHTTDAYSFTTAYNNGVFNVSGNGTLTLTGAGDITLLQKGNMEWSALSAVIVTKGDVVIDGAVMIANLGGTAMSYGIDMQAWGSKTVDLTMNAGTISSVDYRAIRLYGGNNETFTINMNGGVIRALNNSALMLHEVKANYVLNLAGGVIASNGYAANGAERAPIAKMVGTETITCNITGGQLLQNGQDVTSSHK